MICPVQQWFALWQNIFLISNYVPVLIHSRNLERARHMDNKLTDAGFYVTRIPMDELNDKIFLGWLEEVSENWEDFHE